MGKVERAAYLLQHSLCVCHAAGDEEATSAVFIGNEWRWRRARRVGEKSYALCAADRHAWQIVAACCCCL